MLNKPYGLTSNAILQQVKHLFFAKKAGHTGSLDPMATGMLPLCFGEATKFSQYLLDADKCYEATGLLGIKTNTGDALGEVIARATVPIISLETIQTTLAQFIGCIQQTPSMFSALKHQGRPLYTFARAGIDIPRSSRLIEIHALELNHFDGNTFSITVRCSKGTYIRTLIEDIGDALGVGAHVIRLHRLYTAGFASEPMWTWDSLAMRTSDELLACLHPTDRMLLAFPKEDLTSLELSLLRQGKVISRPMTDDQTGCVRLYEQGTGFVGLGEWQPEGILRVKRLLSFSSI